MVEEHGGTRRRGGRAARILTASVLLLAVAGCGTRWSDDQRAEVASRISSARSGGDSEGGGTADGGSNGGVSVGVGGGGTTTGGTGTSGGGGTATGGGGTSGGGGGTSGSGGALPCAAPSDAPGVSDSEIVLASLSSLSGPIPGLGTSALEAARAYVAYRNATGGVCGRQLVLRTGDDGADNGRHRALVSELGPQVLAIVGGLGGGDAGSADEVVRQQLPAVNTAISEQWQNAETVFDINPPFADPNAVIGKFRYLYEQGVRTASIVYIGADQTRSEILGKQRPQMEAAGIQVVNQQELPLSTLSFDSAARGVANSRADYMLFLSDASHSAAMARAMADTGYQPMFEEYVTAYGSSFIELAGEAAAEGSISWTRTLPNEEQGSSPEQAAFLEWMDRTAPDTVADTFAADSWSGSKAVMDALEALTGPITREALLAQLRSMNEYNAGGLLGTIQLGNKLNNGCAIAMIVEGGQWRRRAPDSGFLC